MMTNVIPRPRIALIETWSRIVVRFSRLKKPGTAIAEIAISARSAPATP
jgi:hypothetical protein